MSLRALFAPRAIAVVGASTDPDKLGGAMAANLASTSRPVFLVNPRGAGMHPDLASAASASPTPIDLAVLCVPAPACVDVVEQCGSAGVRAALVCAGGFAEVGGAGVDHQRRLVASARAAGVRLLGPNTSGFFIPGDDLRASFVPGVRQLQPGSIAVVAASGGLNHALAFALQRRGLGISLGVGIGAGADVTAVDVLEHLVDDEPTRAVLLHLESVADGPALLDAVRRLSARKPVVALVVGEHDLGDFAASHTGALATSWRTTRALLAQAGAVVVDDEVAAVEAAAVLSRTRMRSSSAPGVALVTAQAGPGLLVADALQRSRVGVPPLAERTTAALAEVLPPMTFQANPVDTGRPGPEFGVVLTTVAADPAVDALAVYALTEPVVDLPRAVADAKPAVPVVVGVDGPADEVALAVRGAAERDLALVVGASSLATATAALVADARQQHLLGLDALAGAAADGPPVPDLTHGPWSEAQVKDVLDALGVRTPRRVVCADAAAAHAALAQLGGPVAVKVSDPGLLHKSEVGGVHLDVATPSRLDQALAALPDSATGEVLVEAMATPGVDLVVGARRDPVFGPVVLVGVGGTATEVYADVAIAGVPSSSARLAGLLDALAGRALTEGFRGAPAVDRDELADVLGRVAALLLAHPEVETVELNPLRATADGLVALDAVLVPRAEGARP
jgi:acetate---CoA ligase (ADP-forming)